MVREAKSPSHEAESLVAFLIRRKIDIGHTGSQKPGDGAGSPLENATASRPTLHFPSHLTTDLKHFKHNMCTESYGFLSNMQTVAFRVDF